ncbi:hypothetical protein D3C86_1405030 [compost metagenome]
MQQSAQVDEELLVKRQIEPQPCSHGLIGLRVRKFADDRPDRIGRHDPTDDEGDAEQDEEADDQLQKTMSKPAQ